MFDLFYKIWMDCIRRAKQQSANKESWQLGTMIFMTLAMSANFILAMTVLEKLVFKKYFYKIDLPFLPTRINNLLAYLLLFILPCIIANYLLIFRKKRYEKLLPRYKYYNGKVFLTYFLISMFLPIVLLWVGIIFFK
ncbi:hypothetical protein [Asinibacterium sp. OR53]|uniref:hypothetical protein n=1 Tax=Asinibacterium sp. OR53 TaxID=925409 RepID=UPI00047E48D8|nr:hypothetical protein [Asinibacterium sp. OR53]